MTSTARSTRRCRRVATALTITASLAATAACGSATDIDAAFAELTPIVAGPDQPEHPVGTATAPSTSDPLADPSAESGLRRYSCTSTPYSLTTTPDKIVMQNPDSNKLWVGGLLQGDGYAKGLGSLLELPIRKRAPLTIFTDLLGSEVTTTVEQPNAAAVQQAIAALVQQAKAENVSVPLRASYAETEMDDTSQGLLKLGFSATFLGASATGSLAIKKSAQERSFLVSFYQRQFTVSMVTPERSSDLFSRDFTAADLEEQRKAGRISEENPPVVVSSISYGRVLLYSVTSKESTAKVEGALKAAYANQTVDLSGEDEKVLKEMRVRAVNIGGREADFAALIKSRKIADYFSGNSDLATAVPISYQLNNVVGKLQAASFNETTTYNQTECRPLANKATVIGATVRITPPTAYLEGPRNPAWAYGNVRVSSQGTSKWAVPRDKNTTFYAHDRVDLPWDQPDAKQPPWTVDLNLDDPIRIQGNINCKLGALEFGADPSNQYDWTWRPSSGQYGDLKIQGFSPRCRIDLATTITKINDLYRYEP